MDLRLLYALILGMLPISELRGGIPFAVIYANAHNIPAIFTISSVILANILVIFFVFYFLDNLNHIFLKIGFYRRFFEKYLIRVQKKADKFELKYKSAGFIALMIFVAMPIPGTGAWTGCFISWLLGLDRKKSIYYIALGVLIAGIIVSLATFGVLKIIS